jgi:hypothetical protein
MSSRIILTISYFNVAMPFSAKLAEAVALIQAEGVLVEPEYIEGSTVRWQAIPASEQRNRLDVRVVPDGSINLVPKRAKEAEAA